MTTPQDEIEALRRELAATAAEKARLSEDLQEALARQRAFVPDDLTAGGRARPYTPAPGES